MGVPLQVGAWLAAGVFTLRGFMQGEVQVIAVLGGLWLRYMEGTVAGRYLEGEGDLGGKPPLSAGIS